MAALGCIGDGPTAPDGPSLNPNLPLAISVHPVETGWDKPAMGAGEDRGVGPAGSGGMPRPRAHAPPAPRRRPLFAPRRRCVAHASCSYSVNRWAPARCLRESAASAAIIPAARGQLDGSGTS